MRAEVGQPPTIYDWGGGREAFERWLNVFCDLVEQDELLSPVFGGRVGDEHRRHATIWWSEVMGGPADPEFRAAIMGYAEWGSRLAVHNSRPGAVVAQHAPVPRWGWGVAPPYEP